MGYFSAPKIERVTLPSNKDYWVDVQTNFRYGDFKQAKKDIVDAGDKVASADKFLLMCIKSWNLDDDNGAILPINPENIDLLDYEDALAVINAAGAEVESEDTKKNSSKQ